jgi:hypothetical protein
MNQPLLPAKGGGVPRTGCEKNASKVFGKMPSFKEMHVEANEISDLRVHGKEMFLDEEAPNLATAARESTKLDLTTRVSWQDPGRDFER